MDVQAVRMQGTFTCPCALPRTACQRGGSRGWWARGLRSLTGTCGDGVSLAQLRVGSRLSGTLPSRNWSSPNMNRPPFPNPSGKEGPAIFLSFYCLAFSSQGVEPLRILLSLLQ